MREKNGGCAGFMLNFFGIVLISILINFLTQNMLFFLVAFGISYAAPVSLLIMAVLVLISMGIMAGIQGMLRQEQRNYIGILGLLLIPVVIAYFGTVVQVGIYYSVFILIWSMIFAGREK